MVTEVVLGASLLALLPSLALLQMDGKRRVDPEARGRRPLLVNEEAEVV